MSYDEGQRKYSIFAAFSLAMTMCQAWYIVGGTCNPTSGTIYIQMQESWIRATPRRSLDQQNFESFPLALTRILVS